MEIIKIWIYFAAFNATLVTIMNIKNPVCFKAHLASMFYNVILGPISTIGCILFLGYMTLKKMQF